MTNGSPKSNGATTSSRRSITASTGPSDRVYGIWHYQFLRCTPEPSETKRAVRRWRGAVLTYGDEPRRADREGIARLWRCVLAAGFFEFGVDDAALFAALLVAVTGTG